MDGYRVVYHDNPADVHAPDAVNAVAELLAEEGRALGDQKLSRAAIGQYQFLRTQYPGSRLRVQALLAEGRINEEMHDAAGAKKAYAGVVKEAPGSDSAGVARGLLAGLSASRVVASQRNVPQGPKPRSVAIYDGTADAAPVSNASAVGGALAVVAPTGEFVASGGESATSETHVSEARHGAPRVEVVPAAGSSASLRNDNKNAESTRSSLVKEGSGKALAEVTGIRHWSTPTYTRVAIDLGDEVKFEAARVPHPDRIYFDLHGARLAAELVGKSFDVTDDGFLRKIRAAQASGDVTRVVLDVSDVTEYSAFLLPNPYRLIIDIHGGKKSAVAVPPLADVAEIPVPAGAGRVASAAANSSGLPAMATTDGGDSVKAPSRSLPRPSEEAEKLQHPAMAPAPAPRTGAVARATVARPVPNTVAVKAPATTTEVAAVSAAPGRVEATSAPTSKPIVAVSKGLNRGAATDSARAAADTQPFPMKPERLGRAAPSPAAEPGKAAEKTAAGETSLVRALGLKIGRIVIDAGHGGHDSGTLGVDGIQEKDVVLDVALRLGKLLHERLGAEIIYTRSDDTFIPLETRTAIANKAQADLFLSIHANSSQDETARGVETYYLNFTSDPTALDVAARENAVGGQGVHQLSDLVKKIALKDKIAESREFASDVEGSLYAGLEKGNAGLKNRGVKKAPFVVLIGANMPSILAEISFVTNGRDAAQLREPEYRQRVAESLFNGVAKYEGGLAGARPAVVTRAAR